MILKRIYITTNIYFVYYLRGKRTSPSGHYIVKRNETGEKLWSVREDHTHDRLENQHNQSIISLMKAQIWIHIGMVPIAHIQRVLQAIN